MAAAGPIKNLVEEATCSICLEFYKDPVTTECGHNFCRPCIIRWWGEGATGGLCPQCKTLCHLKNLRANRQLLNVVEITQQLSLKTPGPPGEGLCEEHQERLKLFCEEDEKLICVICQVSSDHEQHKVCPVKEAAEVFKHKLQDILKPLREQMGAVQQCKLKEEESCRALRNKLEAERKKIETEFEKLRQTLKEQEQTLLRRIEEMNKKIITVEHLKLAKVSAEIACLKGLITEIEEKCGQPAGELLQDIRSTLSRSRRQLRSRVTEEPVPDSPKTASIQHDPQHRDNEDVRLSQCKHVIVEPTPGQIKKCYKELLTLDADTAHQALTLSEERRRQPLKLGVYLDYEGDRLSVYNADTLEELYTFIGATFTGRVCPYFCLYWGTDLRIV